MANESICTLFLHRSPKLEVYKFHFLPTKNCIAVQVHKFHFLTSQISNVYGHEFIYTVPSYIVVHWPYLAAQRVFGEIHAVLLTGLPR